MTDTTLTKLFVGGLSWDTKSDTLHAHFSQYGPILEAVVLIDKQTGRSKGYGFVTFAEQGAAQLACATPNPTIDGRRANCNLAALGAKTKVQNYSMGQIRRKDWEDKSFGMMGNMMPMYGQGLMQGQHDIMNLSQLTPPVGASGMIGGMSGDVYFAGKMQNMEPHLNFTYGDSKQSLSHSANDLDFGLHLGHGLASQGYENFYPQASFHGFHSEQQMPFNMQLGSNGLGFHRQMNSNAFENLSFPSQNVSKSAALNQGYSPYFTGSNLVPLNPQDLSLNSTLQTARLN